MRCWLIVWCAFIPTVLVGRVGTYVREAYRITKHVLWSRWCLVFCTDHMYVNTFTRLVVHSLGNLVGLLGNDSISGVLPCCPREFRWGIFHRLPEFLFSKSIYLVILSFIEWVLWIEILVSYVKIKKYFFRST